MRKLIRYGILAVVVVIFGVWLYPNEMRYSTTSQFTIVSKYEQDNKLWIQGYDPNAMQRKEIKVRVKDRETWNSMSANKTYMITHFKKGEKDPVFVDFVREQ